MNAHARAAASTETLAGDARPPFCVGMATPSALLPPLPPKLEVQFNGVTLCRRPCRSDVIFNLPPYPALAAAQAAWDEADRTPERDEMRKARTKAQRNLCRPPVCKDSARRNRQRRENSSQREKSKGATFPPCARRATGAGAH